MLGANEPGSGAEPDQHSARRRDDVAAHLAATRTFGLLAPPTLAHLASTFSETSYSPGHIIAREGDLDGTLRIVIDGSVALDRLRRDGRPEHVATRGYGGVLGEYGVFAGLRRSTSAVALQPTVVLYADRDELWSALGDDQETFDHLVLPDAVRERLRQPSPGAAAAGERAVAVYRRHWSRLATNLVLPVALVGASLLAAGTISSFLDSPWQILAMAIAGLGVPLLALWFAYLDYWYDLLIITNRRVIHIDRTPLIRSRRAEAPLVRVQDVLATVPGPLARILGYGNITIQTAGTRGAIHFDGVAQPEAIKVLVFDAINRAHDAAKREKSALIAERLQPVLRGEDEPAHMPGIGAPNPGVGLGEPRTFIAELTRRVGQLLPRTRIEDDDGTVVWRKHWWVLVGQIWLILIALIASLAAMARSAAYGGPVPAWAWLIAAAGLAAWLLYRYEDWRNDLYILSDDFIVDVEKQPLGMFGERRQALLGQIQDIRYVVPNPIAVVLNFGNVVVETASETGRFTFDHVHDPASVQEEIFDRIERLRAREARADEHRRADEMARWFREYHRLAGRQAAPATE